MKIYAIGIPWDSASVDRVEVFTSKEEAEAKALHYGIEGFNGYVCEPEIHEFEVEVPGHSSLLAATEAGLRLCDEALPKFNWGASALDANAIKLLNEVPRQLRAAIAQAST